MGAFFIAPIDNVASIHIDGSLGDNIVRIELRLGRGINLDLSDKDEQREFMTAAMKEWRSYYGYLTMM